MWHNREGRGRQETKSVRLMRQQVSASLGLNGALSIIRDTDSSHYEVDINKLG